MTYIIAVANQKGGVGKTTTAVTLGHGLALKGYKTLLVDADPQGHVGYALGLDKGPGMYQLIVDAEPLAAVTTEARPKLDVILSNKQTESAKHFLVNASFGERILARALTDAPYDIVLIDLAPSLDILHVCSLVAANFVIIPTRLDTLSADGLNEILHTMAEVNEAGYPFDGYKILPTQFDRVTKETMTQFEALAKTFGTNLWPPIVNDVKVRESTSYGQTLWDYNAKAPALMGYQNNGKRIGGYLTVLERLEELLSSTN